MLLHISTLPYLSQPALQNKAKQGNLMNLKNIDTLKFEDWDLQTMWIITTVLMGQWLSVLSQGNESFSCQL